MDKRSWTSPEPNRYYAAFIISPKITACHPHLLPSPCPQRGCRSCCPALSSGEKPCWFAALHTGPPVPVGFPLAGRLPQRHSFIFCIWVLWEVVGSSSCRKVAFAFLRKLKSRTTSIVFSTWSPEGDIASCWQTAHPAEGVKCVCSTEGKLRAGRVLKPQEHLCRPILPSQLADLSACPWRSVPCKRLPWGSSPGFVFMCLAALLVFEG